MATITTNASTTPSCSLGALALSNPIDSMFVLCQGWGVQKVGRCREFGEPTRSTNCQYHFHYDFTSHDAFPLTKHSYAN